VKHVDRSRLPAVGPDPRFVFPVVNRTTLANGLRVWTVERRGLPVLSTLMLLPSGSAADPDDRPGLAALTADMLDEGSGNRSAIEIEDAFARLGSNLGTEIGPDATVLTLTTMSRHARRALELLSDVVARPRLDVADFSRVRDLRANRVVQQRDVPSALADRAFARLLYAGHPYGHLATGTERALLAMEVGDVVGFYRRAFGPDGATLIMAGDQDGDVLVRDAEEAFSNWSQMPPGPQEPLEPGRLPWLRDPADPVLKLAVVPRAGAPQSELRIGHVGVRRETPDYHALLVLNTVLGGQFVSRLNMNLRENKGFTYGVRSSFDFRKGRGPFVIQLGVATSATVDAIREALAEITAIRGPRPATEAELAVARASLTRGYPRGFETTEQIARAAAQMALHGLPADHFEQFMPSVNRVGEADVGDAALAHLTPARAVVAIVGDCDRFAGELGSLGLGEPALMAAHDV
jgi:predicted Zn-dependent peptidase